MASRKQFLGWAEGLTSRFAGRSNDIGGYWRVGVLAKELHDSAQSEIQFDLLSRSAAGDQDSQSWLRHRLLATQTPQNWLRSAILRVEYTPNGAQPSEPDWPVWVDRPPGVPIYRVVVSALLVDDRGRERQASFVTWCWDHDPRRELRSSRRGRFAERSGPKFNS